jgi:hypothetical protein
MANPLIQIGILIILLVSKDVVKGPSFDVRINCFPNETPFGRANWDGVHKPVESAILAGSTSGKYISRLSSVSNIHSEWSYCVDLRPTIFTRPVGRGG